MQISRDDLNPCTVVLEVVCSAKQVETAFKRVLKEYGKRVRIPGFRAGQAPSAMIEKAVPLGDLEGAAMEEAIRASLRKALTDESLNAVAQPAVDLKKFTREPPECEYTAKVPLAPQVELGEYEGLQAEKYRIEVTEADIERQIDELRSRSGQRKEVADRGLQAGDNALVNIKIEGDEGDGRNFVVVAGQTFEGLDTALMGMQLDDIKSVDLTFPEAFEEQDLAGQTEKCTVTLRSLSAIELPALDDDFAKSLSLEDVSELRARVETRIREVRQQLSEEMVHERIIEQLHAASTVHVADNLWEAVAERRLSNIKEQLKEKGTDLGAYVQQNGMTEEQFVKAQRQEAKTHVERAAIIDSVFKQEGLAITNEDTNAQFLKIAYENNVLPEKMTEFAKEFGPQIQDEIVNRTMYAKVLGLLTEKAKITEVDPPVGPTGDQVQSDTAIEARDIERSPARQENDLESKK